jgi:hypothetical protein
MNIVFQRENSSRQYPTIVHVICGSTVELRFERISVKARGRIMKTLVVAKKSQDIDGVSKMLQMVQAYIVRLQKKGYIFKTIRLQ